MGRLAASSLPLGCRFRRRHAAAPLRMVRAALDRLRRRVTLHMLHRGSTIACGVFLAAAISVPAVAGERLQPHEAVYRMTLGPGSQAVDVASAEGVMVYRAAHECGGWTVENRTVIRYSQTSGGTVEDKWMFASWEADDALSYRFRVLHESDDEENRIAGTAKLERAGGPGRASYSAPEEKTVELASGTLFPTDHLARLLAAAKAGEKIFNRIVFDGTTEENPYLVNVVIAPLPPPASSPAQAAGAVAGPLYWTRGAFFPSRERTEVPEFEMTIELRADGIAERVEQVFEDMSLRGTLLSVKLLPQPEC